jgi:hypothetical protein
MEKEATIMKNLKGFNTILTVGSIAMTSFELMIKAFKWYEKRHGKKDNKDNLTRPIIKGI